MKRLSRNTDLAIGSTAYYYPNSVKANGLQPCKILEKLDVAKHGLGGGLTYYLVQCSCSVDDYVDMKTSMQLYVEDVMFELAEQGQGLGLYEYEGELK